jgi:phospholipase C
MSTGDAPVFHDLARRYALSDNYHQPIMGGTGANFIALVTGDAAFFTIAGVPALPFANQIENPDPGPRTNNFYLQDGYAGGSYVNCADPNQLGVRAIRTYLGSLPYRSFRDGNCADGHYYLVNNYGLGFTADGSLKPIGPDHFTLPPQNIPTIADALSAKGVSWKYYSGGRSSGPGGTPSGEYCGICDPLTGFTAIMTTSLKDDLQDVTQFYVDVLDEATLPAVSFIRPFESKAGHPADSTPSAFESFVQDIVDRVQSNPAVWAKTAILITVDEGGGYYDSGYIQTLDFFGDGTRIPLIAVSPWARPGHVDHTYADHVSILKFIEKNWGLRPLSDRSRDNLPNPAVRPHDPYVPANAPAISDLMSLFDFDPGHGEDEDRQ